MRVVEVVKPFNKNGADFKAGHAYVMDENSESQYRSVSGDFFGMSHPFESAFRKYNGEDLTNKKILVFRTGGIGDVGGFLAPVFPYLKKKYPGCFIRVATACKEPLENMPSIDELHGMPFDVTLAESVDYVAYFQGIIEAGSDKSKATHAVDMFFSYFNIDSVHLPIEDKKPHYFYTEEEMKWLTEECKKIGLEDKDYVIGIQMETSAPLRNYPKEKFKIIIDVLAKEEDVKICLIGGPPQAVLAAFLKGSYPNVIATTDYTVRQSMILVNRYNLIVSPDSFMVQIAGGMDKPLIGIYGPFSSELRMKYFKNAVALEPKVVCSPCFKHDFRACIKGYPSPCFSLVNPEELLQAINYQRKRFYGGHFKYMAEFMKEPNMDEIEKYLLSADKGLCFFGGYFQHDNIIRVDTNMFVKADITDLSQPFDRGAYPFVLYFNNFGHQGGNLFNNTKGFVRPGGHYIAYKNNCNEQFFTEMKRDLGKNFVILYSKLDPVERTGVIVGRKPF